MIVMDKPSDKPLLDSNPQEGNTESYSRSIRVSSTLENFHKEYFRKFSVDRYENYENFQLRKFGAIQ